MKMLLLLTALAGVAVIGLYTGYVMTRPEKTITLGEVIHHDDFDYSVAKVKKIKNIGSDTRSVSAGGTFYVVTLKVENNAVRVNHRWDISMTYVEDQAGTKYRHSVEAQKVWDETQGVPNAAVHNTPRGAAESADIVFDLPENIQNPCLKIRKDVLVGDVFDGVAYRKVKVPL